MGYTTDFDGEFQLDRPVDFLGRYETLQEDFRTLAQLLGEEYPAPLEVVNDSERRTYPLDIPEYYADPEIVDIVRELYAVDFQRFNYPTSTPS